MTAEFIPHIGVAGVTTAAEAKALGALSKSGRPVMIGVLASPRTLGNGQNLKTPRRFPRGADIPGIFQDDDGVLNAIHVCDWGRGDEAELLWWAEQAGGGLLDALQINCGGWPEASGLAAWKSVRRRGRHVPLLTVQVSRGALDAVRWEPHAVVERLRRYVGIADQVLFDPSGGMGLALPLDWAAEMFRVARADLDLAATGVGFAGGFGRADEKAPAALVRIAKGAVSLSAEANLRDESDGLCLDRAADFVRGVYDACARVSKKKD